MRMEIRARKFVLENPILKQAEIVREIGWNVASFNLWLHGKRGINEKRLTMLVEVLKRYCFDG